MKYKLMFTDEAGEDIEKLGKFESKSYKKLLTLLRELELHPRTGTGHPESLSGNLAGRWSRRITKKHRLIYKIKETAIIVLVLSAYGHYGDK